MVTVFSDTVYTITMAEAEALLPIPNAKEVLLTGGSITYRGDKYCVVTIASDYRKDIKIKS